MSHHPPDYSASTYIWVVWLSLWGALAAYLQRIKHKGITAFSPFLFFCEVIMSSFVGLLTFHLADWQGLDARLTAVSIAISAHFSTRAVFLLREAILKP